jgi:hypothetical protein
VTDYGYSADGTEVKSEAEERVILPVMGGIPMVTGWPSSHKSSDDTDYGYSTDGTEVKSEAEERVILPVMGGIPMVTG